MRIFRGLSLVGVVAAGTILAGCGTVEQLNRDSLRYQQATHRGTESYDLDRGSNSLDAAMVRADQEIRLYERHVAASQGGEPINLAAYFKTLKQQQTNLANAFENTPSDVKSEKLSKSKRFVSDSAKILEIINKYYPDILKPSNETENYVNDGRTSALALLGEAQRKLDYAAMVRAQVCYNDWTNEDVNCTAGTSYTSAEVGLKQLRLDVPAKMPGSRARGGHPAGTEIGIIWPPIHLGLDRQQTWKYQPPKAPAENGTASEAENRLVERTQIDEGANSELIRAYSSTASIAQMRDLLTEPSFPKLLPTKREVRLGCLPPPESAAFEATARLSGSLSQTFTGGDELQAAVSGQFASNIVQLFEESERTLFLQYALFRLCEMSINAPSGFRNVYPVVIHDIVRRTAEMRELADQAVQQTRLEQAKTEQLRMEMIKTALENRRKCYEDQVATAKDNLANGEKLSVTRETEIRGSCAKQYPI